MIAYKGIAAKILINRKLIVKDGKYVADIKVYEVGKSPKYPEGIKAKYVLLDIELDAARLLLDNHHPFGFHLHTKLPNNKGHRELLQTTDFKKAMDFFLEEIERILKNEE